MRYKIEIFTVIPLAMRLRDGKAALVRHFLEILQAECPSRVES
jgi:hypothetical protein